MRALETFGRRPMPSGRGARLDEARATVRSLREEQRRLERVGLELPIARCHEQLRYWEFVASLLVLSSTAAGAER